MSASTSPEQQRGLAYAHSGFVARKERSNMMSSAGIQAESDTSSTEGILLTDASLRIIAFDAGAACILTDPTRQNGRPLPAVAIPEDVAKVLRSSSATELTGRTVPFQARGQLYVCRSTWLRRSDNVSAQPLLVLSFYRDMDVQSAIAQFATEYDLTERERQTLIGIANGLTCKEIADQMSISPNTVKSFLRLLMVKIGVSRRGGIISKVLDHHRRRGESPRRM